MALAISVAPASPMLLSFDVGEKKGRKSHLQGPMFVDYRE
jgi:hypothetical protein